MFNRQTFRHRALLILCGIAIVLSLLCLPARVLAQADGQYEAERKRAFQLMQESKFTEALPILEKLASQNQSDGQVIYALGFSVFANSQNMKEPEARKKARSRARELLLRAKELGAGDELSDSLVKSIPPDGGDEISFSANKEADQAMHEGEAAFTRGELDKALAAYDRALRLDPKLYEAALFAGDMYFKMGFSATDPAKKNELLTKAGEWFAKAIAINPDTETAYRYWGDALMGQDKTDEARAKYIDAIIAEPYKGLSYAGIEKWAQQNKIRLAHPQINVPETDNQNQTAATDGSNNWKLYTQQRAAWADGRFAKEMPNEKVYRHSLMEETVALRTVAEAASRDLKSGKVKSLEPSLAALVKLNDAGLLEPYILFVRADRGIARDYATYRQANRDKLRRYWNEVVIAGTK